MYVSQFWSFTFFSQDTGLLRLYTICSMVCSYVEEHRLLGIIPLAFPCFLFSIEIQLSRTLWSPLSIYFLCHFLVYFQYQSGPFFTILPASLPQATPLLWPTSSSLFESFTSATKSIRGNLGPKYPYHFTNRTTLQTSPSGEMSDITATSALQSTVIAPVSAGATYDLIGAMTPWINFNTAKKKVNCIYIYL